MCTGLPSLTVRSKKHVELLDAGAAVVFAGTPDEAERAEVAEGELDGEDPE